MALRWASILTRVTALYVDRLAGDILAPYDLSLAQFKILMFLYKSPEDSVTTATLEDFFQMSHSTSVGLLNRLEKGGWLMRIYKDGHGRAKVIHLTPYAKDNQKQVYSCGTELEKAFTAGLSEAEVDEYIRLSRKIIHQSNDEQTISDKAGDVFNWDDTDNIKKGEENGQ